MAQNSTPRYRWQGPHDWLNWKIDRARFTPFGEGLTVDELKVLLLNVDPDAIQEQFQSAMDEDGYFTDLNKRKFVCPQCGNTTTETQLADHGICKDCQDEELEEEEDEDFDEEDEEEEEEDDDD